MGNVCSEILFCKVIRGHEKDAEGSIGEQLFDSLGGEVIDKGIG